jgi:glycosyltransferase involved in cell wall biosynthesis
MKSADTLFHRLNDRYKFDLVHFNEPHVILEKLKLPTVCTLHSAQVNEIRLKLRIAGTLKTQIDIRDLILKGSVGSIFDVFTAHAVDKIICPSPNLAALVRSYCLVSENKIAVVPNGIDVEPFKKTESELSSFCLKKFGLEEDNYILFMGRLGVMKGVQYAIEAFRGIGEKHPNLKMAIVGKGDFEGYLKDYARAMENVVFTGYVGSPEVRKILYENSLLVVVPSLYEVLPMVVLEAMARGKAIIGSNVGGIPLLVRHGKNGFLTPPGDPKSLEEAIRTLCDDENLRNSMGLSGRELLEKEFSSEEMVNRTLELYTSLC